MAQKIPPGTPGSHTQYFFFQKALCFTAHGVIRPGSCLDHFKASALQIPFDLPGVIITALIELTRIRRQWYLLQTACKTHFHARTDCGLCQIIFNIYFYLLYGIFFRITKNFYLSDI